IPGVASYGLELFRGAPALDAVFVPIGWGSGAVSLASVRNALGLKTRIIGVVSASAPTYALSMAAGHVIEQKSATRIADGVAISRAHPDSLNPFSRLGWVWAKVASDKAHATKNRRSADLRIFIDKFPRSRD